MTTILCPGAICRFWLLQTMRRRDVEPRFMHVADEYATQMAMVAAGLGYAVLPRLGRTDVPGGVRLVAVDPALTRHVYAIWRKEAARRPAIRAMVDALRHAAGTDVQRERSKQKGVFGHFDHR